MRERIQCLIVENKKILFVKDDAADHYYPPGGGLEEGEDHAAAITRELLEELNIQPLEITYYSSYEEMNVVRNIPQLEHNYFVTYEGEPCPNSEIEEICWVSWEEVASGSIKMPPATYEKLLVPMHQEGII